MGFADPLTTDNVLTDFDFDSFLHDNNAVEGGTFHSARGFRVEDLAEYLEVNKPASVIQDFSMDTANPLGISSPLFGASPQDNGGGLEGGIGEPHITKTATVDKAFPTASGTFSMLTSLYYE